MKIVCEACQAKYSIADDKVRGKVFKIRCKKCSHVIVVRGAGDGAVSAGGSSGEFASSPSSAPDLALDAGWHIVVEGEQVGPLSEGDIKGRLVRGEISAETYIWKEGLADWIKIASLPEFASAAPEGDSNGAFGGEPGGLFANAATSVTNNPAGEAYGASLAPAGSSPAGGGDLFAAPARAPVDNGATVVTQGGGGGYGNYDPGMPGAAGGQAGGLTGQRHENSVLFSLSNLEALARPGGAALPASRGTVPSSSTSTEGSGLIDIRAMANMTLGGQVARPEARASDLPAFSAPQFSPVAPMLLTPQSAFPRWAVGALLVAAVVIIAGLVIVSAKLFAPRTVAVQPAPAPALPVPAEPGARPAPGAAATAPAGAQAPPATPTPVANEALPPREGGGAARSEPRGEGPGARVGGIHAGKLGHVGGGKRGAAKATDDAVNKSLAGAFAPAPPKPAAEAPRKPKDDIEALLEAASGGKRSSAPRRDDDESPSGRAAADSKLPPLGREEIVKGMNSVLPKARDCYAQFKVQGVANAKITVDPRGRVGSVNVSGKFAGTPSGTCVEAAIKGARFAPSAGLTFDYPVPLR